MMMHVLLVAAVFVAASVVCLSASAGAREDALAPMIRPFVDRGELAGAVMLVADVEGTLAVEAVGWADVAARKPMRTDSVFWIASQTKPMTAAALMMLVDEGGVDVEAPVERYLPEFKGLMVVAERDEDRVVLRRPARAVTVRDILTHMSGMPFASPLEGPRLDQYSLAARVRSYAMTPLATEPGERYEYSNCGINTAGRIIEVVSGMPYERFMDERLLGPLGMTDTTFWPSEAQAARIARSYKPGPEGKGLVETTIPQLGYPLTDRAERFPMPGGGLFSTAGDVSRFYRMLLGGGEFEGRRLVSEASVRLMTSRHTPAGVNESYGLGIGASEGFFGHGGAFSTDTRADTSRGLIFVWLVQHDGFPGEGAKAHEAFGRAALEEFGAGRGPAM